MNLNGKRLVNLTGRSVVLVNSKNQSVDVITDAGAPARFIERVIDDDPDDLGITWIEIDAAGPVGIPPPRQGTLYIVNKAVAIAMAVTGTSRDDVVITHGVVKDHRGRYIGVRGLARLI